MPSDPVHSRSLHLSDVLPHLTDRDRRLLGLLGEHQVFTTGQIAAVLYHSVRMCQHRLHQLRQLQVLDRFQLPRDRRSGGSAPAHWTLGRLGLDWAAARDGRPFTTANAARQHVARLAASPTLAHLVGVNGFFAALLGHARHHPDTALLRWWPEREATRRFPGIYPDGHGLWRHHGTVTGFFVEYDRGTEDLPRVAAKIGNYAALAGNGGPRYPVLFWLPTKDREAHLQHRLTAASVTHLVATAVTGAHPDSPAGPVWARLGHTVRVPLHELSSDHGPVGPLNGTWNAPGDLADIRDPRI